MRSRWLRQIAALVVLCSGGHFAGAQVMGAAVGRVSGAGTPVPLAPNVPTVTIHVNGTVVSSVDGKPVARVLVSSMDRRFAALTDWEGRFSFDYRAPAGTGGATLSFGSYLALTLRKPGYVDQNQATAVPAPSPGTTTTSMQLKITPVATISGRVTPDSGELPPGLMVILKRRQAVDGAGQWTQAGGTQVNRNGEFRFGGLTAGDYVLMTSGWSERRGFGSESRPDTIRGLLPTYYPGGSTPADATPIHVAAGETAIANLRPQSATFYRVSVGVEGLSGSNFGASLVSDAGFTVAANSRTQTVEGYLPTGSYLVRVETSSPAPQPGSGPAAMMRLGNRTTSFAHLEVGSSRVIGRTITAAQAGDIRVEVTRNFANTQHATVELVAGPGQSNPPVYVDLRPVDGSFFGGLRGMETQGDTVALHGVPEGTYHVRINAPQGYVASAMAGSTNLLTTPLTVGSGGSPPIYVTLRDDFASLACRVHTDQSADVANPQKPLLVMAIPLDAPEMQIQTLGVYAQAMHVANTNVPPGRYLLIATDASRIQTLEYRNPEVLRELMSKGATVTVGPGEKAEVEVPVMADADE